MSGIAFGSALAAGSLGLGGLLAVASLGRGLAGGGRLTGSVSARSLGIGLLGGGGLAVANLGLGSGVLARSLAAAGGSERPLDFRRRGAPPRRRRRSPLLALAKPLGIAALTVALPLALGAWLLTSRQFQLHGIDVGREPAPWAAAARVPAPWVRQALAPLLGRNLLRLPLAEVRQRLAANPWIAAAEVAKELPDRLRVTVAERRPAVLLRGAWMGGAGGPGGARAPGIAGAAVAENDALLYADAAGRPIAAVGSPAEAAVARRRGLLVVGLPRLAAAVAAPPAAAPGAAWRTPPPSTPPPLLLSQPAPPGSETMPAAAATAVAGALRLAAQLRRLRPGWTAALSQIDVVDEDDYQLRVEGLPCPLLVRGSRLADNLIRFEQLLPELRRRYPALAAVDLRFSRRIVVQTAHAAHVALAAQQARPVAQAAPPAQPVKAAQVVKPVQAVKPVQVVKPVPPASAATTVAPSPPPAANNL